MLNAWLKGRKGILTNRDEPGACVLLDLFCWFVLGLKNLKQITSLNPYLLLQKFQWNLNKSFSCVISK